MNKKILLGSIIAVVILVLVSFTGVVGYQTTKSSTIAKASPLFNIRTQRAIDKDNGELNCDYVGKGEEHVLSIPKRDSEKSRIQKAVNIISKMNEKAFKLFIQTAMNQINQKNILSKEIKQIQLQNLYNFKYNPNMLKAYLNMLERDESDQPTYYYTIENCCSTFSGIMCNIIWTILFLILMVLAIPGMIFEYIWKFYCNIVPASPTCGLSF